MAWKRTGSSKWHGKAPVEKKVTKQRKKGGLVGTVQQEAIWKEMIEGNGHIVVEALAGTGKTTTMVEGLNRMDCGDAAFVAFSKSIAMELQEKVPEGVTACTMHSHGYKAIRDAVNWTKKPTDWKAWNIIEEMYGGKEKAATEDQVKLLAIEKLSTMVRNTLSGEVCDDGFHISEKELDLLVRRYSIDVNNSREEIFDRTCEVIEKGLQLFHEEHVIDFVDMIWLPVVMDMRVTKYETFVVDESQDMNRCQQEIALRSVTKGGRIIVVGDRHQSIFGFTGADIDSIPNMTKRLKGASVLPLNVTRRCPKSHVEIAKKLVPAFEAMPTAIEGKLDVIQEQMLTAFLSGGDMAMCRVNAPLVSGALRCITLGKKAKVQGRDMAKQIIAFMTKFKVERVTDLLKAVEEYKEIEQERIGNLKNKDYAEQKLVELEDKVAVVYALCEGEKTIEKVTEKTKELFAEVGNKEDTITFTSIHRAKGLEAKRTLVLRPEIMQHPMAKTPEDKQQEANVMYVGETRSKDEMYLVLNEKQAGNTVGDFV